MTYPFLKATFVEGPFALVTAEEMGDVRENVGDVRRRVTSGHMSVSVLAALIRLSVGWRPVPQPLPL